MREDMFKVIVERPRRKPWKTPGQARAALARAFPDGATPVTGRRAAALAGGHRHLNENLKPLRRFLARQVGRPWSKVYAEICARLDPGSTVKQHVRDHVEDLILVPIAIGKRGEWLRPSRGPSKALGVDGWFAPLYVDPVDGLIKETAKLKRRLGIDAPPSKRRSAAAAPDRDRVACSADEEFRRFAGVWYRVRLGARVDEDFAGAKLWCAGGRRGAWREVVEKRQLSSRELAKAGLANAPR